MGPGDLQQLLAPIIGRGKKDSRLLVGPDASDDAGVYLLDENTALVQTVDVITPVVDDPSDFGAIAAVNALSDIYAMGADPLTALSFLAFDPCRLPTEIMSRVLEGAVAALEENGCCLVGGHTVEDDQVKVGFAVTGKVAPWKVITNGGARAGDLIYLTKPLGTGITATALKGDLVSAGLLAEATRWMRTSNREASLAMREAGVSAATDVTGFGLLGHLFEMCAAGGLGADLDLDSVPIMDGVVQLAETGMVPAGAYNNRRYLEGRIDAKGSAEAHLLPLFDPQTSGGMLIAVSPDRADILEIELDRHSVPSHRIGCFTRPPSRISLLHD